jgi:hypothetical protein
MIKNVEQALHVAYEKNYNVILPQCNLFNTCYIEINPTVTKTSPIHPMGSPAYNHAHGHRKQSNFFEYNATTKFDTIVRDKIKSIFCIPPIPLNSNDIVVHLRSGDIMRPNPHPRYIVPPLCYYVNILNAHHYDTIYIISEDTHNPCLKPLLHTFPNSVFRIQSLKDDIGYILGASNLIVSFGTFVPELARLSTNNPKIYIPNYLLKPHPKWHHADTICNNLDIISINLSDYAESMYPWRATQIQKERIISYKGCTLVDC